MTPTTPLPQETLAAIARLLHHAARQATRQATAEGPGSVLHLLGLGIQVAACEAANLLPEHVDPHHPAPAECDVRELLLAARHLADSVSVPGMPAAAAAASLAASVDELLGQVPA